jgi:CO/xanthine dehydrogenase FAD-binding subunit
VPLTEFFTGPGKTVRKPNELLRGVEIPAPKPGFRAEFHKFGTRPALDISAISAAVGAVVQGGKLSNVRIALGAVAPTPVRVATAEAILNGHALNEEDLNKALEAVDRFIHPISDVRASDWYRRELVRNSLKRMLLHVSQG